ncbi:MAG: hypothetical protein HY22_04220 [[Candidatus Thermochlorobacteriaceae] bacterium GBChlB]|nr:MAG: hypothetical protein HY22_04220 [[Candidatus Thermochlorobacteriaceae] bacterium GBChlB]
MLLLIESARLSPTQDVKQDSFFSEKKSTELNFLGHHDYSPNFFRCRLNWRQEEAVNHTTDVFYFG